MRFQNLPETVGTVYMHSLHSHQCVTKNSRGLSVAATIRKCQICEMGAVTDKRHHAFVMPECKHLQSKPATVKSIFNIFPDNWFIHCKISLLRSGQGYPLSLSFSGGRLANQERISIHFIGT
jgi:hypothetical protein